MIFLQDFLQFTNGTLHAPGRASQFSAFAHDSRQISPGELFVAVRGERHDGHDFIEAAVQQGAAGVVAERDRFSALEARQPGLASYLEQVGVSLILVQDTRAALRAYARSILQHWRPRVIAVTGSVGKTTTKEAIATILGHFFPTFKSWRNYNDLLGLPLSLGRLEAQHQFAVLELGCDHPGEIKALCELIQPSIGIVTRVSHTQLQYFGTIERYAQELEGLPKHLPSGSFAILNYSDIATRRMAETLQATPLFFGYDSVTASPLQARCLEVRQLSRGIEATLALPQSGGGASHIQTYRFPRLTGVHWVESLLAAITTALAVGIDGHTAATLLEPFTTLPGRLRTLPGIKTSLLLDDTHNAPPIAVEAALNTLDDLKKHHPGSLTIAVLGAMLRLGTYEAAAHEHIGNQAAQKVDWLITYGPHAEAIALAARRAGMPPQTIEVTYNAEDAFRMVRQILEQNSPGAHPPETEPGFAKGAHPFSPSEAANPAIDEKGAVPPKAIILIKGSEEMRMERVTELLLAQPEQAAQVLDRQTLAWKQIIRMRPDRPTWVEIDLSAIGANCRRLKQIIGPDVELLASLKADAYGHGALRVAHTVLHNGASRLGVATLSEAVPLRQAGITAPILVFGYLPPWQMREAVRLGITVTVYALDSAQALSQAAQSLGIPARAHLKIDSGMGRLGLRAEHIDTIVHIAAEIQKLPGLELEGIFTHFACADSADQTHSRLQLTRFQRVLAALEAAGLRPPVVHAANSAATLTMPEARFNMVRPGIALYGLHPSAEVRLPEGFQPALAFKTQIAQVKDIPAGECISYGCTFVTPTAMRIAVLPVGYADGFRRAPTNWGEVLVRGKRAPLLGRVCMDQCMIDVSAIPGVSVGDEVVLIGQQGDEQLTAEMVAERLGTINYEVVSEILARVPRVT